MTIDYYNQHAASFVEGTLSVDMQSLYQHFVPLLPAGAHIVDAGCGSGRDALYFLQHGFVVTAFDGSTELAEIASKVIGQPVQVCRFDQFVAPAQVDAIWACASLLHVPASELPSVMEQLSQQLVSGGVFYCSFKYGRGEVSRGGRSFTNLDEDGLNQLLNHLPLTVVESWQTGDVRPGRESERWLNAVLRKA
jgi:SAM-dependent methyltransferase